MCGLSWDFNRINDNYMYKAVMRLRIYMISSQDIIPFLATPMSLTTKGGLMCDLEQLIATSEFLGQLN